MKLSDCAAVAAVIGGSFLIPVPAEARDGWVKAGCHNGACGYVKVIRRNYPYVTYESNSAAGMFTKEADCHQYKKRILESSIGPWRDATPGSMGEAEIRTVCR